MTSNFDTSDRNAQKGGDFVPRLAMINDIAGFGRCSTTVSLPVISVMKVQVCPVPTSVLSNHLGFPLCHFDDYTSHMRDYIKVWGELGLTFDGLYCGFLGNEEQIDIVREFVEMFRPPLFLLDPVMGDHGRAYSSITETHVQKMKELLPLADIITPNITEACLLTGTPWKDREWTLQELSGLCERLADICQTASITSDEASTGTTASGSDGSSVGAVSNRRSLPPRHRRHLRLHSRCRCRPRGDTTNLRAEGCELRRTVHRRKRKGRNTRAGGRGV